MVAWEATALPLGDTRLGADDYSQGESLCQAELSKVLWLGYRSIVE